MTKAGMILAAGLGTRMRPLTNTCPKSLILVAGKTMLQRSYEHLKTVQAHPIVVNSHHLAEQVQSHALALDPEILMSYEEDVLETGGGIKKALPLLGKGAFFTLNGDMVWTGSESLQRMETLWNPLQMEALLLIVPKDQAYGYVGQGDFLLSPEGRLTRPEKGQLAPYVYMGVQLTHPGLFKDAPEGPFSLNVLWDKALKEGRLFGLLHEGELFHFSTPEDLATYGPAVR